MTLDIPDNIQAKVFVPMLENSNQLKLDNKIIQGKIEDNYIYCGIVGSGNHYIELK